MKKGISRIRMAGMVCLITASCSEKKESKMEDPRSLQSFELFTNTKDTFNRTDVSGRRQRDWKVLLRNTGEGAKTIVLEAGNYVDGMKQGYWVRRKKNGELIDSVLYRDDEAIY